MCRKLNALDVRLHQRSLEMLQQRRQQLAAAGSLQALPPVLANTTNTTASKGELCVPQCCCMLAAQAVALRTKGSAACIFGTQQPWVQSCTSLLQLPIDLQVLIRGQLYLLLPASQHAELTSVMLLPKTYVLCCCHLPLLLCCSWSSSPLTTVHGCLLPADEL